ncbi:PLGG1, partial [Symbiodinium necroappetens]
MAFARGESYSQVVKRDYLVGAAGPPGTGDMLLWCLGPALVSTGVQMFQYRSRIAALSRVLFLTCGAVSLCNVLGTVIAGPLLGVSPEVTLSATMRCVTIPMALPTYARLCDASGAENNVAL